MYVFRRSSHNPILSPVKEHSFEELSSCNGSVCADGKNLHMLYRAISHPDRLEASDLTRSSIGHVRSLDGIHFEEDRRQFLAPEEVWEHFGCEDPRVTKFGGKFYIFYTALSSYPLGPAGIKVAVAISKDLKKIDERHLVTPFNAKAMALFPEKIDGKMTVIFSAHTDGQPAKMALAQAEKAEDLWSSDFWRKWHGNIEENQIHLRRDEFDHVEVGAVPVKTEKGWLLIYSHIQNYFRGKPIFGIEAALLDLKDPKKVIGRTNHPFIVPEAIYEQYGLVPNVTFPTGAVIRGDYLDVYYGASDTTTCRASVHLNQFLTSLVPKTNMKEVTRYKQYPMLEAIAEHKWESRDVFNPAAIDIDGTVHILYLAMSEDNTSSIGLATSKDGLSIDYRHPNPIYVPREVFEQKMGSPTGNSGCEDPRITRIKDRLFMCYTAFDGVHTPRVAITDISVEDFKNRTWNWSTPVLITPSKIDDKDACLFPEKVKDQYMILHRIQNHICADFVDDLQFDPEEVNKCIEIIEPRKGMWDILKVGIGAPPLETDAGWLLLYHGVSEDAVYRVGALLLDKDEPNVVLSRTSDPIFEPKEDYEKVGEVPNVVFPCGAVIRDDTIYMYYGGADRVIGVATFSLAKTLEVLKAGILKHEDLR